VRHILCVLVGHRFDSTVTVMGFSVRRCARCGQTQPETET